MRKFEEHLKASVEDPRFLEAYAEISEEVDFGLKLALRREELGLTQIEVSKATGIKQPMLARIERGQMPKAVTLQKLARALDIRITFSGQKIEVRSARKMVDDSEMEEAIVKSIASLVSKMAAAFEKESSTEIPLTNVVDFQKFRRERRPITNVHLAKYEEKYEGVKSAAK